MRSFNAPLVSPSEFGAFWSEPPTEFCTHRFDTFPDGKYHYAEILKANPAADAVHRAYPTWQPWKTEGAYGPCRVSLDFKYWTPQRTPEQWFSVLTLARNSGDGDWDPVTLNIDENGKLALMHVPAHNQEISIPLGNPEVTVNEWHHIDVDLNFQANGSIIVFLAGAPILYAPLTGSAGLPEGHAGLYTKGSLAGGWMANSNLMVQELPLQRVIH
jgi:hypothetical protein